MVTRGLVRSGGSASVWMIRATANMYFVTFPSHFRCITFLYKEIIHFENGYILLDPNIYIVIEIKIRYFFSPRDVYNKLTFFSNKINHLLTSLR